MREADTEWDVHVWVGFMGSGQGRDDQVVSVRYAKAESHQEHVVFSPRVGQGEQRHVFKVRGLDTPLGLQKRRHGSTAMDFSVA